ncbi:MAG: holin [Dethiobacter sp.]|nr:MAG: holin [Dethiobacter sp.]
MHEVLMFATVILPIVTAVVEAVKRGLHLNTRYAPLLSIVLGVVIGALAYPFTDFGLVERLWAGALAGLGAMGLFDLGQKMKEI